MEAEFAAIFDWDGVIVDSSDAHRRSWEMLAEELKKTLPKDHFERSFGRKNPSVIREILQWSEDDTEIDKFSKRKEYLYRKIVQSEGLRALPGVRDFIKELRNRKIPTAVGSSTPRINLELALKILDLHNSFDFYVTGDDVSEGKPAPEVFLKAGRGLGMLPFQCIVFEDAPVGVEAALNAGMKAVAVLTSHSSESLNRANAIINDLSACNYAFCENLLKQK